MRIPLDYYRILGLPIQATAEQLQQAHRDRIQQLPRREFSEAAIAARKQLIDQADSVLSDPVRRQEYDASFLAKSYDLLDPGKLNDADPENSVQPEPLDPEWGIDPYTPCIEIDEPEFIGALLILLELGEYELVLRLARPYLSSGSLGVADGKFGDPEIASADIVLTVALAYLELGREQWQQGQYENAAASLESGQELLLREGLFANIRAEMQSDLFKLRPYRILELVSLPDEQVEARRQGISLLEEMLHDRGGIDGNGDDMSGLGVDDFLRFIQQLRSYLTSAEQQVLFEAEAHRPSAVATYLAVYALLARGFAQRQPALIRRAKLLLMRLGSHQDVHLEQAVCSLLLGQTEEASRALELSQEFESLAFIRDHSQGSPDLLPGLCLYSERWFQNEVFPHFRDLHQKQASLTEYFADEDVQIYLEELPAETAAQTSPPAAYSSAPRRELNLSSEKTVGREEQSYGAVPGITAMMDVPSYSTAPTPEPVTQPPQPVLNNSQPSTRPGRTSREPRPSQAPQEAIRQPSTNGTRPTTRRSPRLSANLPANLRLDRILLLAALGLLGLVLLGFLVGRLLNRPQPRTVSTSNAAGTAQLAPAETGFSTFANQQKDVATAGAPLTEENAPEIVKSWLDAKAAVLGEEHDTERLEQILVDPALSEQRARAENLKAENSYWKFEHGDVEIVSVETNGATTVASETEPDATDSTAADPTDDTDLTLDNTDSATDQPSVDDTSIDDTSADDTSVEDGEQAAIEALVSEKGEFYSNGQIDTEASYDSTVRARYELVRQDGQWRIQSMQVLE